MTPRPLAVGYLRLWAADPAEIGIGHTAALHAYAEKEGLTLSDVFTDLFDPPDGHPDRAGFCALMDALRRLDADAVIICEPGHLARHPHLYTRRRTIIETETGARLLTIHPGQHPS